MEKIVDYQHGSKAIIYFKVFFLWHQNDKHLKINVALNDNTFLETSV
jgi:hypothetical protein